MTGLHGNSVVFYNFIAADYANHLTESDRAVRERVKNQFKLVVPGPDILDFGGGTGLDLGWLLPDYRVYFLEPSEGMRNIARTSVTRDLGKLQIMESNLDFREWSVGHLPTEKKMNGILANFAVFNCIEELEELFEKLSLISADNCRILATVLNVRTIKMSVMKTLKTAFRRWIHGSAKIANIHNGVSQDVFLHSERRYRNAATKYFKMETFQPLESSPFMLLILSRT